MKDTVLEFQDVSWKYADTKEEAVSHLNLSVKKGEMVGRCV